MIEPQRRGGAEKFIKKNSASPRLCGEKFYAKIHQTHRQNRRNVSAEH